MYTDGNAGFEYFNIKGNHYLATANFWDGKSQDMSAKSPIYRLDHLPSLRNLSVAVTVSQEFDSKGAHGADYFEYLDGEYKFLVLPSYYGCGGSVKEAKRFPDCQSTVIYRFDDNSNRFEEFQRLATVGPSQTEHFVQDDTLYIVVAENFVGEISIFEFVISEGDSGGVRGRFHKVQALPCAGVAGVAAAVLPDNSVVLVGGSYHDRGWKTRSPVFHRLSGSRSHQFRLVQELESYGAHDTELLFYGSHLYLAISEDRSDATSEIQSRIYKLNSSANSEEVTVTVEGEVQATSVVPRFELIQAIPTDGAHASEFFVLNDTLMLAVANFGNRHLKRVDAVSTIWALRDGSDVHTAELPFERVCNVSTRGATDWEFFEMNGQAYLAVSNEGLIRAGEDMSFLYRISKRV